jgi:hypothetical protein
MLAAGSLLVKPSAPGRSQVGAAGHTSRATPEPALLAGDLAPAYRFSPRAMNSSRSSEATAAPPASRPRKKGSAVRWARSPP